MEAGGGGCRMTHCSMPWPQEHSEDGGRGGIVEGRGPLLHPLGPQVLPALGLGDVFQEHAARQERALDLRPQLRGRGHGRRCALRVRKALGAR